MRIRNTLLIVCTIGALLACSSQAGLKNETETATLKAAFKDKFYIGTALNLDQIWERNAAAVEVVKEQFNSIVAENCMKSMYLQPREGEFYFKDADQFVEFGEKNNMHLVGHTLIWHSQAPNWFFTDKQGNEVSRDVLIERMRQHITTVVSRYKGRIKGWDVVNEAILDNGEWRDSKFYKIIGKDFIKLAFEFAHAADPEAELYYNDYSTAVPKKRDGIVNMVSDLITQGIRVDGIGMQEHHQLDNPSVREVENTILAFASLGVRVMVTEMDITVLPSPRRNIGAEISENFTYNKEMNPYPDGLPDDKLSELNGRYVDFFRLYLKHQDKISRVTVWGVGDGDSWRNGWPMRGRTDYPLLFDREYKPKSVVADLISLTQHTND
ncbi:endo-1,4-beta-xylanase [Sphingobacterium alkalisoli]|uniref:Beta-xylanase n=1 Tax=Sphingobacterium alkalisoli TaxID=1874115 RepID=A0A4V5LYH5_9SPHI|nr:endo-1,4-beta-xylanase [Sphingobacterium alkalisoli]TJY66569.1 endo-1,4-beta-xylanase [Sphingobacterium alkalisoli]GGH15598.1 beta-xylanase [Sphingobacterium alkalisoli]